ncbi:adenosine deaminase [Lewinella sp. LCG006]|uniref:adenosine deaminase n=1 Tax=Lewinella sp. LCG006 TaxID=3231911 RepID=UPI00345FDF9B
MRALAAFPKVELHVHLDCSLSFEVVKQLRPGIDFASYQKQFTSGGKCTNLKAYIELAVSAIKLMQTRESLTLVTNDLIAQLAEDQVIYAEIRFAPLQHLEQGLSPEEVVATVCDALAKANASGAIKVNLILCTLRHYSEEESMTTVKLAEAFRNQGVVGFDLAADEAGYPINAHQAAFAYASANYIFCTAHAGEACGAASVRETLQFLRPQRIGHGVRSIEDKEVLQSLLTQDIHLEICPSSNVVTSVVDTLPDHPVDHLYRQGVSLSINTDGRALVDVDLTHEYEQLTNIFGWEKAHFLRCNLEAIRHAFIPEAEKEGLRARLLVGYGGDV